MAEATSGLVSGQGPWTRFRRSRGAEVTWSGGHVERSSVMIIEWMLERVQRWIQGWSQRWIQGWI